MSRTMILRCVTYTAIVFALLGVMLTNPAWAESWGLDVWNLNHVEAEFRETEAEGRRLDEIQEITTRQMLINEQMVHELILGRRTLRETADIMLEMNRGRRDYMNGMMSTSEGSTVEAKMTDMVFRLAKIMLRTSEFANAEVRLAELRCEYESEFGDSK
jgi:hypothetical protein